MAPTNSLHICKLQSKTKEKMLYLNFWCACVRVCVGYMCEPVAHYEPVAQIKQTTPQL